MNWVDLAAMFYAIEKAVEWAIFFVVLGLMAWFAWDSARR